MTRSQLSWPLLLLVLGAACDDSNNASHADSEAGSADAGDTDADGEDAGADEDAETKSDAARLDAGDDEDANDATPNDAQGDAGDAQTTADAGDAGPGSDLAPVALARPFRSGKRLKARYYKVEGVPDAFGGMLDTQTQAPCRYVPTAGGGVHCLPQNEYVKGVNQIGFLDDACKQPVYRIASECSAPHDTQLLRFGTGCRQEATLHKLEALASSLPYFTMGPSGCAPAGNAPATWLREGAALPLDGYVSGSKKLVANAGGLTREVIVGSDGSVDAGEIVTKAERLSCRPEFRLTPGACHLSTATYYDGPTKFYLDDQCATEVERDYAYSYVAPECPAPTHLIDATQVQSSIYGARKVGKRVSEVVYSKIGGCRLATTNPWSRTLFELGEKVELPKLVGSLAGSGRLRAQLLQDEAGSTLGYAGTSAAAELYQDSQTNRGCQVTSLGNDLHCLPELTPLQPNAGTEAFSDPTCSTPLLYCNHGNCAQTLYVTTAEPALCRQTAFTAAYTPGELFAGTRYRRNESNACVEDTSGLMQWTRKSVTLSSYAKVERIDEPLVP